MKRKKYLQNLPDLLITIGSYIHASSKIDGIEKSFDKLPLEVLEDLKDLIDGEIIFRSKKKGNSHLRVDDSIDNIH